MQGEAVLSAVKGVEMKDYSSDPIPAHQSVNLEFALGKLPEATAKNTTGLEAATDHLKAMAERHVGHKAEAGYGQDEGNWAINLAFQPEAKEALTKALPEIQKMTKKAAVQLNN
ncbi:MAG: hypothetical protein EBX37_15335 [Alphaproteobacteria bacterium]|nr:hypothetical protein [Alphaproteobacteria bacterium]